jgi:hypothetical protein
LQFRHSHSLPSNAGMSMMPLNLELGTSATSPIF